MKIIHIITDLDTGGAEMMLYKLLASLHDKTIDFLVISLMGRGEIAGRIEALDVKIETLNLAQGERPGWQTIKKLKQFIKTFSPDIVQGWMYHGNMAATIAVFLYQPIRRKVKLFWNIRQTLYDLDDEKPQTSRLIKIGCWLSFLPQGIIYNSVLSADHHIAVGFSAKKTNIIPNGFDLQKFRPDQNSRQQLYKELKISEGTILIGHISRLHPMKDHATLLRTIDHVIKNISIHDGKKKVLFLLVGYGVTSELSTNTAIRFLGERIDIPKIMSALDILVSSSAWGEGFPNVIGEAMASEVPCVVTDVGDSAHIVGKYGIVCPIGNEQCLSSSIMQLIEGTEERKIMGKQARQRVKNNYSMDRIKIGYLKEWGF